MVVAVDTSAKIAGSVSAATVNAVCVMTIAANACLIVGVSCASNVSVSACAVNGTQLTQLGRVLHTSQGAINVSLFGLTAAPAGTASISANFVGGVGVIVSLHAGSFTGHRGVNPFGTLVFGTASAVANFALSFSTSNTDQVVFFGASTNVFTAMNATTLQSNNTFEATRFCTTAGTASTLSLSFSASTPNNSVFVGINIAASVAAATTVASFLAMTGVGI